MATARQEHWAGVCPHQVWLRHATRAYRCDSSVSLYTGACYAVTASTLRRGHEALRRPTPRSAPTPWCTHTGSPMSPWATVSRLYVTPRTQDRPWITLSRSSSASSLPVQAVSYLCAARSAWPHGAASPQASSAPRLPPLPPPARSVPSRWRGARRHARARARRRAREQRRQRGPDSGAGAADGQHTHAARQYQAQLSVAIWCRLLRSWHSTGGCPGSMACCCWWSSPPGSRPPSWRCAPARRWRTGAGLAAPLARAGGQPGRPGAPDHSGPADRDRRARASPAPLACLSLSLARPCSLWAPRSRSWPPR